MGNRIQQYLHLPSNDRSYWKSPDEDCPLRYLAWGRRNFMDEPIALSRHEGWVVGLILEGMPTLVLKDENIPLPRGNLFALGPDCASGWTATGECKLVLSMWKNLPSIEITHGNPAVHRIEALNLKEQSAYEKLHVMCQHEVSRFDDLSHDYLTGLGKVLGVMLARSMHGPNHKNLRQPQYARAKAWLHDHLDSKEPVSRLCDYLSISQSSLYRLFQHHTGKSPLSYVHQLRMEKSKELLQETDLLAKEIAFRVGYNHLSDFSRALKKYHGMSATSIRSIRNENRN